MTFINYLPSIMIISPIVLKILRFWTKKPIQTDSPKTEWDKTNDHRGMCSLDNTHVIWHVLFLLTCWAMRPLCYQTRMNSVLFLKYKFHTFRFEISKPSINKVCSCRVLFLLTVYVSLVRHRCQTQGCSWCSGQTLFSRQYCDNCKCDVSLRIFNNVLPYQHVVYITIGR